MVCLQRKSMDGALYVLRRRAKAERNFLSLDTTISQMMKVQYDPVITVLKGPAYVGRYWQAPLLMEDHQNKYFFII